MSDAKPEGRGRGRGYKARGKKHFKKPKAQTPEEEEGIVPRYDNYADARVQALMIGDRHRTTAYYDAVMNNKELFEGKTVMDVGAGQGILSLFAAKAGAKKVYAVERSSMARVAKALVKENGFEDIIEVCNKDVDNIDVPPVDVIISEWMGVGLVHERMLEVVLRARDRFLKKEGGTVFPTTANLFIAPLVDDGAESELYAAHTWNTSEHYGIDWSVAQKWLPYNGPHDGIVDDGVGWPLQRILAPPSRVPNPPAVFEFDLRTMSVKDCCDFRFTHTFENVADPICGYVLWFDVTFKNGLTEGKPDVVLPTGPADPPTHWRQLAWYFSKPMVEVPKEKDTDTRPLRMTFSAMINPRRAGYYFHISDSLDNDLTMDSADFLWNECR